MKDTRVLLLNTSLYELIEFTPIEYSKLFDLKYFNGTIDFYCVECDTPSTFKGNNGDYTRVGNVTRYKSFASLQHSFPQSPDEQIKPIINQYYVVEFVCTRDSHHKALFVFKVSENDIMKIGQFPSIASLTIPDLRKYKKVLTEEQYKELNRGIGLITHGVGIGSFVYLRRIFENLI